MGEWSGLRHRPAMRAITIRQFAERRVTGTAVSAYLLEQLHGWRHEREGPGEFVGLVASTAECSTVRWPGCGTDSLGVAMPRDW